METEDYKVRDYEKRLSIGEVVNYRTELFKTLHNDNPHQSIIFDTVADLVDCVDKNKRWHNKGYPIDRDGFNSWRFGSEYKNYTQTREALLYGTATDNMLKQYDAIKEEMIADYPELFELQNFALKSRKKRKFAEEGAELDIDRLMCGDPEHWIKSENIKDKKTLKILFNGALNCDHDAEDFVKNIIVCICFIDVLRTIGLSAEFWNGHVVENCTTKTEHALTMVKVKDADESIDVCKMLSTGLPGLFRWYTFKIETNILQGQPLEGLGSAIYYTPAWIKDFYKFDVCVNASDDIDALVNYFVTTTKQLLK